MSSGSVVEPRVIRFKFYVSQQMLHGSHRSCTSKSLIPRIVEDGICFPSVAQRIDRWETQNQEQKQQAASLLLGHWYAQAAVKWMRESGTGFSIDRWSVEEELSINPRGKESVCRSQRLLFDHLFDSVEPGSLAQAESLQRFARAFGYSATALEGDLWDGDTWRTNLAVHFKPAA